MHGTNSPVSRHPCPLLYLCRDVPSVKHSVRRFGPPASTRSSWLFMHVLLYLEGSSPLFASLLVLLSFSLLQHVVHDSWVLYIA
jgi:hypothetical protein